MTNISFDLSGKIDREKIEALLAIKKEADDLNIPFFVVGAFALDIILKHCYGITPRRMTGDIDLGINIANWKQFDMLISSLISTGKFSQTKIPQRYIFDSIPIDIVPFGAIADKQFKISWPPGHEIFMSIAGFEEAFQNSIIVRLNSDPELDIKIPTLPGLAVMKLISWKEKYPERSKDADDLLFIMQEYERAGIFNRLYENEQALLTEENFDNQLAGIRLLGRDIAMIVDKVTAKLAGTILDEETGDSQKLIIDIMRERKMFGNQFNAIHLQLKKLKQGFVEALKKSEKIINL